LKVSDQEVEMGRICSTKGEMKNMYAILIVNPEGKAPFRRSGHRCEVDIKMAVNEIG
jgi:hypothetical protein